MEIKLNDLDLEYDEKSRAYLGNCSLPFLENCAVILTSKDIYFHNSFFLIFKNSSKVSYEKINGIVFDYIDNGSCDVCLYVDSGKQHILPDIHIAQIAGNGNLRKISNDNYSKSVECCEDFKKFIIKNILIAKKKNMPRNVPIRDLTGVEDKIRKVVTSKRYKNTLPCRVTKDIKKLLEVKVHDLSNTLRTLPFGLDCLIMNLFLVTDNWVIGDIVQTENIDIPSGNLVFLPRKDILFSILDRQCIKISAGEGCYVRCITNRLEIYMNDDSVYVFNDLGALVADYCSNNLVRKDDNVIKFIQKKI